MIGRGETTGVFQIESRAQMTCCRGCVRRTSSTSSSRSQSSGLDRSRDTWCTPICGGGRDWKTVEYPSPELEKVLGPTLGVPLFQEQVMSIAVVAGGFSPAEADRCGARWPRGGARAGWSIRDKLMAECASVLRSGLRRAIYQQILGFGSYGFPQSHAASFALLTYAFVLASSATSRRSNVRALLNSQPMGFYQLGAAGERSAAASVAWRFGRSMSA